MKARFLSLLALVAIFLPTNAHGAAYSFRTVGGFEHGVGVGEHIAHV